MEGLIPFLLHAIKKQSPQHAYRCLSGNSTCGYHLLIGADQSNEGSSRRRMPSEFQPPTVDSFTGASMASSSNANNGLRQGVPASTTNHTSSC